MRYRYQITLSREGWWFAAVLAFILGGALVRQINLLMLFFGLLASPILASWRLVKATLRRVEIRRKLPDSISAGDLLVVELTVTNRRRRLGSWALAARDAIRREPAPLAAPEIKAGTLFPYVPPGESRMATYRGRLTERGSYRFGPLQLSTRFPLGLVQYRVTYDSADSLIVFPRLGRLQPMWQRLRHMHDLGVGHLARRQGFLEGEFYGLRDWRHGDSRRWVHWRTSARRQSIVVRQFEQQRNQDLALVADLWQPEQPEAAERDTVELAVSFAATVVADMCRSGGKWLCLAIAGREVWCESGPSSTPLLHGMMSALALAEASHVDRLPQALAEVLASAGPGTQVVIVGTRATNLADTVRFSTLMGNSLARPWLSRIRTIDASREELADYFVPVG